MAVITTGSGSLAKLQASGVAITPDGAQVEHPNNWLKFRNLWEIKREDIKNVYIDRIGRISVNDKLVDETTAAQLMVQALEDTYSGSIGFEFMHIHNTEVRNWIRERIEARVTRPPTSAVPR